MTKVWQIAAGSSDRDYTDLFLKYDLMFMGPGNPGDYNENEKAYIDRWGSQVRAFAREVKEGDVVILRNVYHAVALGIIYEDKYEWNSNFDDVFGWDLQHTRRVTWQEHLRDVLEGIQRREAHGLFSHMKQIPTFSRVHVAKVLAPIEPLFAQTRKRALKQLPSPLPKPLNMDEVGQELFSKGLPNDAVDKVLVAVERQRRLVKWYEKDKVKSGRPTEHEVVAHMVLPLMLALGWSEQLLAVEWRRIDLAGFSGTPTTEERCIFVCEAKGLGHGLQNVLQQAKLYVERLTLSNCCKILISDGVRLYLYGRKNREWADMPIGYLNVNSIRTNHIAPENTNAIDTIMALAPSRIMEEG